MRKITKVWFQAAHEDCLMAQKAMEIKLYRQVCFHSQQCAEKGLKAAILEKGKKLRKVHDLLELSKDIEDLPLQLPASIEELDFLNRVYQFRYPPDIGLLAHGEPTKEDAQKALEIAQRIFTQVEKMLRGEA
jgi:HEPN domain-containing protein